jgi:hypothetical protein
VKATDTLYVLSGLAHDTKFRSNLLLTETSGANTSVQVELFQSNSERVTRGGLAIPPLAVDVPALSTIQLNDADIFADVDPLSPGTPYALVTYRSGVVDDLGISHGSVVPFATVIDNVTQDSSLRVGVSTKSLNPGPRLVTSNLLAEASRVGRLGAESRAARYEFRPLAARSRAQARVEGLPYGGGPAPLFIPVAHLTGAGLAGGVNPFWRTRVSFTNVNENEQRTFFLKLLDQTGNAKDAPSGSVTISRKATVSFSDVLEQAFRIAPDTPVYGAIQIDNSVNPDGSWAFTWADIDVQSEIYTLDPNSASSGRGQFSTGMEGFSYLHGYSSFQSNLGTVQFDGAETSSRFRTNLILEEVGGAWCRVAVSAYKAGSFVPMVTTEVYMAPFTYISMELFYGILGLRLTDLTDVRIVVRQVDGDGVYMAFASKINLATGDPDNVFLRPATAGTGR